jgi:hypothetical protein
MFRLGLAEIEQKLYPNYKQQLWVLNSLKEQLEQRTGFKMF